MHLYIQLASASIFQLFCTSNAHICQQHNTTQHNTTQHSTAQHSTAQRNTTQRNATQSNSTQHSATQHNRHNTTQHNRHNTTQHNTKCWPLALAGHVSYKQGWAPSIEDSTESRNQPCSKYVYQTGIQLQACKTVKTARVAHSSEFRDIFPISTCVLQSKPFSRLCPRKISPKRMRGALPSRHQYAYKYLCADRRELYMCLFLH